MPVATRTPTLSPREFDEIREIAYRAFGLDLKSGKEELVAARLGRVVNAGNFGSFHEYARHIAADATGQSLAGLADALTTNHSFFLREAEHFDFFRQHIAPALARRAHADLWCAACATGEEAWTLACVWNEASPGRDFRILASDISNKALRRAQAGEYSVERCAGLPKAWLDRYFERAQAPEAAYRVNTRLRAQVEFRRINLIQPLPWQRQFAAIFCRNVMIYFDRPTQQDVVRRLTDCLEPGGYLFTGHAESLAGVSHALEYVQPAVYRKAGGVKRA